MTIGITDDQNYHDIADAIRSKTGGSGELAPGDMAAAIDEIEGAGEVQATLDSLIDRSITEISSDVTSIGDYAFASCKNLTSADFPNVTSLGSSAFSGCSKLTSVDFPIATSIGSNAFTDCSILTSVDFPIATSIGNSAFYNCYLLTSADFPNATSIGGSAFSRCSSLATADFSNATIINVGAFSSCSSLTTLVIGSESSTSICALTSSSTSTIPAQTQIYVPDHQLDSYKAATNWAAIADRIHPQSELPEDEEA